MKQHRKALKLFLNAADEVERALEPILRRAAGGDKSNTVVVMTMNAGMTDMIMNFVRPISAAKRKSTTFWNHACMHHNLILKFYLFIIGYDVSSRSPTSSSPIAY